MNKLLPYYFVLLVFISSSTFSQENNYFRQVLDEFEKENYPQAIELLKQAEYQDPTNPDIYYYLGYFCHYLAYDSRPMKDYDLEWQY
jgi:tetratricopeptide (TPR) repeat protein